MYVKKPIRNRKPVSVTPRSFVINRSFLDRNIAIKELTTPAATDPRIKMIKLSKT
jgi:hypothetical protein